MRTFTDMSSYSYLCGTVTGVFQHAKTAMIIANMCNDSPTDEVVVSVQMLVYCGSTLRCVT